MPIPAFAGTSFDQSYDAINGLSYENAPSRYVVREGDTLASVSVHGD